MKATAIAKNKARLSLAVPRGSIPLSERVLLTHKLPLFGVPIPSGTRVVINARRRIYPHLLFLRLGELVAVRI